MRSQDLEQQLANHLQARSGWRRHETRPACFVHSETGLQILMFPRYLTVVLSRDDRDSLDKGLNIRWDHHPRAALEAVLETADALVMKRVIDSRRARPRKGGFGLASGDMLLVLLAQQGGLTLAEAADDPQWTAVGDWPRKPSASTLVRALSELKSAQLVETTDEPTRARRRIVLTRHGWPVAVDIAQRVGIPLPDPAT